MKIVAILQARLNSTRLPGKIMLPLAGIPMVEHVYRRVSRAASCDRVLVAIPKADWNGLRDAYLPFNDLFAYEGDEADLVARYLACATREQADLIVRVPCDNPCVDPAFIDEAIETYLSHPFVYYSNTTACVQGTWLDGIGCEVVSYNRLQWLDQLSKTRSDWREHPHKYFEDQGLLCLPKADLRLDINTWADYDRLAKLFNSVYSLHPAFTSLDCLTYFQQEDPYESLKGRHESIGQSIDRPYGGRTLE